MPVDNTECWMTAEVQGTLDSYAGVDFKGLVGSRAAWPWSSGEDLGLNPEEGWRGRGEEARVGSRYPGATLGLCGLT